MAFLDNSGDIILDAVLTDTGGFRLAKGDGTFKITKFAFGDDEIDYGLYDKNHASGSAYYDLEILQTPILEAFTNNTSTMKSKLMSLSRTNLLYLPVMKLNTTKDARTKLSSPEQMVVVAVDTQTQKHFQESANAGNIADGVAFGAGGSAGGLANAHAHLKIDQGLDTREISPQFPLDNDLIENQYIIELDSRLGRVSNNNADSLLEESFIDDDMVATYFVSTADPHVSKITATNPILGDQQVYETATKETVISGPRGTTLEFSIRASIDLNSSTYLFEKFGTTSWTGNIAGVDLTSGGITYTSWAYIDSLVRVTGATTGYRLDIPVKFVKIL